MIKSKMNLVNRMKSPTPKYFRVIRTIGICIAAMGGSIIASPVAFPAGLVAAAGYLTVAGGVMTAVAQATVEGE